MKKIFFVLPLGFVLSYCSSTKPNIATGVSNVQVNGSTTASTSDNKIWTYSSTRDTSMNGTWQLEGMMAADGSWKGTESWVPVDSSQMMQADSATTMTSDAASSQTASSKKGFSAKLYDTSTHFFDTASFRQTMANRIKPFAYWQRIPEIRIKAGLGVFTGNTGCNSMSGSFNFNATEIKIDPRIRTSKMSCNDYDESVFVSDLLRVNSYVLYNNKLELKQDNTTVLTFTRKTT